MRKLRLRDVQFPRYHRVLAGISPQSVSIQDLLSKPWLPKVQSLAGSNSIT
jgi:hypothetical protein